MANLLHILTRRQALIRFKFDRDDSSFASESWGTHGGANTPSSSPASTISYTWRRALHGACSAHSRRRRDFERPGRPACRPAIKADLRLISSPNSISRKEHRKRFPIPRSSGSLCLSPDSERSCSPTASALSHTPPVNRSACMQARC